MRDLLRIACGGKKKDEADDDEPKEVALVIKENLNGNCGEHGRMGTQEGRLLVSRGKLT